MLYESLKRGDPLDAEWFWEAGMVSTKEGTPLDIVIWNAVRELLEHHDPHMVDRSGTPAMAGGRRRAV